MKKGIRTHTTATAESKNKPSSQPFFQKKEQAGHDRPDTFFQPPVQAKLKIGSPNDKYEKEADKMADTVTSGKAVGSKGVYGRVSPLVQMKEEEETLQMKEEEEETVQMMEEEEESMQMKEEKEESLQMKEEEEESLQMKEEEEETVQRRSKIKVRNSPNSSFLSRLKSRLGFGDRLSDPVRKEMETSFGADFSSVRIHKDDSAANLSKEIHAQAFTTGKDIFFNKGKFDTGTSKGTHLLAHELTHTIQQGAVEAKPNDSATATRSEIPIVSNAEGEASPETKDSPATPLVESKEPVVSEEEFSFEVDEGGEEVKEEVTEKAPNSPEEDPQFQEQLQFVEKKGKKQRKHQPKSLEVSNTKKAAKAPANEVETYSKGRHVEKLEEEGNKVEPFNKEAFKKELQERIKAVAPDSLGAMEKFKKSGGVDRVKNSVKNDVKKERENTAGPLEKKNKEKPDQSGIEEKEFAEMPDRPKPPSQGKLDKTAATPKPKTTGEWEAPAERQIASFDEGDLENDIDDKQLEEGNEPEFNTYLDEKQKAKTTISENIQTYRSEEETTIGAQRKETEEEGKKGLRGFSSSRKKKLESISKQQGATISKDEKARLQVSTDLEKIFTDTKSKVDTELSEMEEAVNKYFDAEAKKAQDRFTDYVETQLDDYKDRRYSGLRGKARKLRDWWKGLPSAANKFYVLGKNQYLVEMNVVIDQVATLVVNGLNAAQKEIVSGREKVQTYLSTLKGDLKKFGDEVAEGIESKFDSLESSIQNKQQQMIGDLAKKYADNLQQVNEKIEKWKEDNKGMAAKIKDFALGIWRTIKELAKLLWSVVQRIGNVVGKIIKAPIRFFQNLVKGVKQGFTQFKNKLVDHLKAALFKWLFGTMGKAGIKIPATFDLKGIFSLILQVLGLGVAAIRERAVKILGAPIVEKLEKGGKLFKKLIKDGPGAFIKEAKDKVIELKDQVVEDIKKMVSKEIIFAGITFVLGMLTPVGAFIKACKGIYTVIKFFIQKAKDIASLLSAILGSVEAMIAGKVQVAADKVETALAKSLPIIIGFLAALVGIGGLATKVRKIVNRIQTKIRKKIIDPVIKKAFSLAQKAGKLFSKSGLGKMASKGTAFVKGKAKQAKEKVKGVKDKIVGWWKQKFSFKSKDGGAHNLFYEGKGANAKLMVASRKSEVSKFLAKKHKEATVESQQAIGKSQKAFQKVESHEKEVKKLQSQKNKAKRKGTKDTKTKLIEKENRKLRSALVSFSDSLKGLNFDEESDLFVKTIVTKGSTSNGKYVHAKPLTYLPGNTKGSSPGGSHPPGWSHAVALDSDKNGNKVRSNWVQGHLLNENLHGPGVSWNLVPISQKINSEMREGPEKDAKNAVSKKGTILYYKAKVELFNSEPSPVKDFPTKIIVKWGHMERVADSSPPAFEIKAGTEIPYSFNPDKPQASAGKIVFNINKIGRPNLIRETGISVRFAVGVMDELKNGDFKNIGNLERRLALSLKPQIKDPLVYDEHINRIKQAISSGKIEFK